MTSCENVRFDKLKKILKKKFEYLCCYGNYEMLPIGNIGSRRSSKEKQIVPGYTLNFQLEILIINENLLAKKEAI